MEGGYRSACFFFRDPAKGFGELTRLIGNRFKELFDGGGGREREAVRESPLASFIKSAESRFLIGVRIRSEFGLDANKLNIYEYYLLLEQLDRMNHKRG